MAKHNVTGLGTHLKVSNFVKSREFYESLGFKSVFAYGDEKFRKLRHGEKEVLLWALVMKHGHRRTFFVDREQLRDYDWKIAA